MLDWKHKKPRPVVWERCTLAHDLNNDLTVIVGACDILTQLLKDNLVQVDAIGARVRVIKATAQRMADRIENRPCPAVTPVPTSSNTCR